MTTQVMEADRIKKESRGRHGVILLYSYKITSMIIFFPLEMKEEQEIPNEMNAGPVINHACLGFRG